MFYELMKKIIVVRGIVGLIIHTGRDRVGCFWEKKKNMVYVI